MKYCFDRVSDSCSTIGNLKAAPQTKTARRRKWAGIVALVLTFAMCGAVAQAQQTKEPKIGVLGAPEEPRFSEGVAGLKQGLSDLGYAPQGFQILEVKVARDDESSAKSLVEGLLRQRVHVLFLIGSRLLKPVREASAEVPVVFITPGDPVSAGLVASLARPGGNTTAMTFEYPELSGKRLELLKEIAPRIRRVLAVYDPRDPSPKQGIMAARQAATNLGLTLVEREARQREELVRGLEAMNIVSVSFYSGGSPPALRRDNPLANTTRVPQ